MSRKNLAIILGIVVVLIVVVIVIVQNQGDDNAPVATTPITTTMGTYKMSAIATHNSATSCWTAINGNVYDVTTWISQHPGGQQAILSLCGTDGSAAFNGQHSGQARPATELVAFKIGTIVQ